ncbi:MAG: rRNA adenine N-6-methyltransferase family protein [candidate division WOR-3 bacterium]
MEILNNINYKKFSSISDFLAFISIYDDNNRTIAWKNLMLKYSNYFKNGIVVELGAGFGLFSEFALELGAKKVYAIERNRYLFNVLKERLSKYKEIKVININALKFIPKEHIDVVIHDFYGHLLYDESLYILDNLKFKPSIVIPNGGKLKLGFFDLNDIEDNVIDYSILRQLKNLLISDLFIIENKPKLTIDLATWSFSEGLKIDEIVDISNFKGEILLFYLEVLHNNNFVCDAFECQNWSLVFAYRFSDRFSLKFKWGGDFCKVYFSFL